MLEGASAGGQVEVPESLRELYGELDEVLTSAGDLEVVVLKHCIAYKRLLNVASVIFRTSPRYRAVLVYLRLDPSPSCWRRASRGTCAVGGIWARVTWRCGSRRRGTWRRRCR
ncbi:hypothetical protein [Kitasatospora purpeofusca]|uniref:hypothetical protein n=1 Tax=Kitasatospora purpeofusca TaxID=67352 RepID=UPI003F4ABE88